MTWYYGSSPQWGIKVGWTAGSPPAQRLAQHQRDYVGWRTLGWHSGTLAKEQAWHRWAVRHLDPVGHCTGGRREWYEPTDHLLHIVHFNLVHAHHTGKHTEAAWWELWEPRHDTTARGKRRCRYQHCQDVAA